jgi:hypothetical protein
MALAQRVTRGDRRFVKWVSIHPTWGQNDPWFASLHSLARCLAKEIEAAVEAAGSILLVSSGNGESGPAKLAKPAKPYVGRFQHLVDGFEAWLSLSPHGRLVEYLESLFAKELGAIHREEIEQIGLALVDVAQRANASDAAGKKKRGRESSEEGVQDAIRRIGPRRLGELKKTHRDRLRKAMTHPPRDPKTFRKYGA